MQNQRLIGALRKLLANRQDLAFAYLHGSALETSQPQDIDIAVFLHEEVHRQVQTTGSLEMDVAIPLELELEKAIGQNVHLQVINRAPLPFRARVVTQGQVIVDNDPDARTDFEYRSRYEYFDFRPRREAYLAEVSK